MSLGQALARSLTARTGRLPTATTASWLASSGLLGGPLPLQPHQPLTVFCPGQICVPVESSSPLVMSNQKEVLRCFTVLGMQAEPLVSSGGSPP